MQNLLSGLPVPAPSRNHLYYGDNLEIMRDYIATGSVDLIYLDPPFNSQRTYNLIYKQMTGLPVPEQEEAFCDAWELDAEKEELVREMPVLLRKYDADEGLIAFWDAWIKALRTTQPHLLAYLVYMSHRLFEMRRILRDSGSLYLHCDPTASHYIKVIMDGVFGHQNFRSEIIWKRTSAHSSARRYGPVHDVVLFYTKSDNYTWNKVFQPYDEGYIEQFYTHVDKEGGRRWRRSDLTGAGVRHGETGKPWRGINVTGKGRHWAHPPEVLEIMDKEGRIHWPAKENGIPMLKRYLDEQSGVPLQDVWTDISPMHNLSKERLGYPTQKPLGLLERIIQASSNEGDTIFDPFCGCGTSIYAAHQNKRRWKGCDIAILSVRIVRDILAKRYGLRENVDYDVSGVPLSVEGAQELFGRDHRQFQHWAVEMSGGFCSKRLSGDRGIDGRLYFETSAGLRSMVLSVKGGHVFPANIRELRGVLGREGAELAGFICLEKPTKGMIQEAAEAGMFTYLGKSYPRIQIRTIEDLLGRNRFETPSHVQTMDWQKQAVLPL